MQSPVEGRVGPMRRKAKAVTLVTTATTTEHLFKDGWTTTSEAITPTNVTPNVIENRTHVGKPCSNTPAVTLYSFGYLISHQT